MCGIFGSISNDAAMQVLEGLRKLEYRGYDSAGLAAIFPKNGDEIKTERTTGYVSDLVSKANGRFKGARTSIGHTRWATHGEVTDSNAHPHSSNDGTITLVHNGIIENATEIHEIVDEMGYSVNSETDSELIVHLLHDKISKLPEGKHPLSAFRETIELLNGSWAIAVIISGSEEIFFSRKGAPLVVGRDHEKMCISSDVQPLYGTCSEVAYIEDGDTFSLTADGIFSDIQSIVIPDFVRLEGKSVEEDRGIYSHMMLKEIHDQPISLSNVLAGRINARGSRAGLNGFSLSPQEMKTLDRINLIGCGTAFFAAQLGEIYIRELSEVPVQSFRASEFDASRMAQPNTLTIGITQSGETKDTLDALQKAKISGGHISSICNVIGSTIARFTGNGAYLHAGPEFAVASTKAFTNMVCTLLLLALTISNSPISHKRKIVQQLRELPNKVATQLQSTDSSYNAAINILTKAKSAIFIGRGLSVPLANEGALKMMEVAYLPCLAYPSGELKHGAIALIEEGTPVIAIAPTDSNQSLIESSIRECKSRGAKIILITDSSGPITKFADVTISTGATGLETSPIINSIPLQLLAYFLGFEKGLNVDRPRNLAKSVTVI